MGYLSRSIAFLPASDYFTRKKPGIHDSETPGSSVETDGFTVGNRQVSCSGRGGCGLSSRLPDGAGEVGLAGSREADEDDVRECIHELARQELQDLLAVEAAILVDDGVPVGILEAELGLVDEAPSRSFRPCPPRRLSPSASARTRGGWL